MRGENLPTVSVISLGYIGLPTAAVIARTGMKMYGVDVSQAVVDTVSRGEIHIEEVGDDGLVHGGVQLGLLRAGTTIEPADVFVAAVPTPFHRTASTPRTFRMCLPPGASRKCSSPATR